MIKHRSKIDLAFAMELNQYTVRFIHDGSYHNTKMQHPIALSRHGVMFHFFRLCATSVNLQSFSIITITNNDNKEKKGEY
jgi:hypothetical protein